MNQLEKTKLAQVASYLRICADQLKVSASACSMKAQALATEVELRLANLEAAASFGTPVGALSEF